jgi:hypothetical protein
MGTEEKRPRRAQSQTDRDIEGLAALRDRRAREAATRDDAVPEPFEGIDTGITPRIAEDCDLNRLYTKILKQKEDLERKMRAESQRNANLVLEVAGERPPDERFQGIEKRLRLAHWVISALVIPVVATVVLAVKYVYARGAADVRIEIEHKQLLEDIADLKTSRADMGKQLAAAQEISRQNTARIEDLFRERPPARKLDTSRSLQRAPVPQSTRENP